MIKTIYQRAIAVLMKKPIRLWAIGLLGAVLVGFLSLLGGFVPIIGIILTTPAEIGLLLVYLHGYRGEEIYSAQLLEVYEKKDDTWKRLVIGMLWKDLWVFIWALIPIAGIVLAIIKSYQYRLTPYILAQEPEVKPTDAIRLSKERTKGYVGAMFGADFLPYLAVSIVAMILAALARIKYIGWLFGIVMLSLPVLLLVVIVIDGKWYLPAERRREWSRRFFLVTDRRAVSPYDTVADDFDRLFPPVVKRVGRDRANVYFAARPGSPPPRRPNAFNAVGFLDLPYADVPAALAALEELRNSAAPRTAFRP